MHKISKIFHFFNLLLLLLLAKVLCAENNVTVHSENTANFKELFSKQLLKQPYMAKNIALLQKNGKEIYFYNIAKDKFIILNFFATWIPECRYQLRSLNELQEKLTRMDNNQIKIINVIQEFDKTVEYFAQEKIKLDFYIDTNGLFMKSFGINMPSAVVILNKNKEVLGKYINSYNWNEASILQFIQELSQ